MQISPFLIRAYTVLALIILTLWQIIAADGGKELISVMPYSDSYFFHYSAWFKANISDNSFVSNAIVLSPYEALLSQAIRIFGHSNLTPFILNSLLVILTVLVVIECTLLLFSKKAALYSAFLYVFCEPLLFFAGTTLKSNLVIFLASVALLSAIYFFKTHNKAWIILFSLSIAVCAIDRIHILVFPCVFILYIFAKDTALTITTKYINCGICLICIFCAYTLSKPHDFGEPEYYSSIGLNIYMGHTKPDNWGLSVKNIDNHLLGHRADSKKVAQRELGKPLSNSEVTVFWLKKTWDYVKQNPDQYLIAQLQKVRFLFSSKNYLTAENYFYWRKKHTPLKFMFVDFALVFALFFLGSIILYKKETPTSTSQRLTITISILYLLSMMATIVIERYRAATYIFMLPIAGFAVNELIEAYAKKKRITIILCFIGLFVFVGMKALQVRPSQITLLESQEKENRRRVNQTNLNELREAFDQQLLSKAQCHSLISELYKIGYARDSDEIAKSCI